MKKLVIIAALWALFFQPFRAFAADDYVIQSYDVNMVVNEDNTFDITEKIGAFFNEPRHGIFRKIPLRNTIVRLDGTKSHNRAIISNIKVSDPYDAYNEGGNRVIKMGDRNKTLTGAKNYTLSYKYNIGKDTGKGYDELYFNLVGTGWDTEIDNISFTITMPKPFDKGKLGFSAGAASSTGSTNVIYAVSGNTITGQYAGKLKAGEGLTVRLELPEGYFVNANTNTDLLMYADLFLPVLFVLFYFPMWVKYGKDDNVVETVEFYPPGGFNSAELGFLYKGNAEDKAVVSLLIYLANKGYIKIAETDKKSLFSKTTGFKVTKIKEYDGDNANEEIFFKGLFQKSGINLSQLVNAFKNRSLKDLAPSGESVNEVTNADLQNSFYITLGNIKTNLNKKENKEKIFEKGTPLKRFFGVLFVIITLLLITVKPVLEFGKAELLVFAVVFPGIGFSILIITLVMGKQIAKGPGMVFAIIFGVMFGVLFGGLPWVFIVLPALVMEPLYLLAYVVGMACIAIMVILIILMSKRTTYGNEILGKIRGFRNFLEAAEKEKLEALVADDPVYFYNILPFTYALDVSDKWIRKFETIALQPPGWYGGTGTFNAMAFSSFMTATMASASTAMTSAPSSGSSSGGGSSGGGSGGGGGGSW